MKRKNILPVAALIVALFLLNFHIIRMEDDIDIIPKDSMSLRETYIDVRDWGTVDYLAHSARVRNYLIYEKNYANLVDGVRETTGQATAAIKTRLRPIEEAVHEWLSEKLD